MKTWVSESESVWGWTWPDLERSWCDLETWPNSMFFNWVNHLLSYIDWKDNINFHSHWRDVNFQSDLALQWQWTRHRIPFFNWVNHLLSYIHSKDNINFHSHWRDVNFQSDLALQWQWTRHKAKPWILLEFTCQKMSSAMVNCMLLWAEYAILHPLLFLQTIWMDTLKILFTERFYNR